VELASKQLTMDFVNQGVLQPGPHELSVDHEKLDYAEKLHELNQHWAKVDQLFFFLSFLQKSPQTIAI
jgi:hypothetical protein